jgi:hypothetical protein
MTAWSLRDLELTPRTEAPIIRATLEQPSGGRTAVDQPADRPVTKQRPGAI